jgi:hypothetical protein
LNQKYSATQPKYVAVIFSFLAGWDLALAIALVSRWEVRQWQVPKAWARIFLGCGAVVFLDESLFVSRVQSPVLYVSFKVPVIWETLSCPCGEA